MALEKKIDGRTYRFDKLPANSGLPYMLRLMKVVGSADGVLMAALENDELRSDRELAIGIAAFCEKMDPSEVTSLITELIEGSCKCEGQPCVVGVNPQDVLETFTVFAHALRVNYADFFDASGPLAPLLMLAKRKTA